MIISIRGTSGSGKTTIARRVKAWWGDDWSEVIEYDNEVENDKIVGYISRNIFLCGPYREGLQSGGVDSVKWGPFREREHRLNYYLQKAEQGYHLIYEGLMESAEVNRNVVWNQTYPVHAVFLDTPIEECFARINKRRELRGVMEPVSRYHTERKYEELQRAQKRLAAAGVDAPVLDEEAAFIYICKLLDTTR